MALTKIRGGGVDSLFDDEDSNIIIGRGRIGNTISASDHASFQHRDLGTGSNNDYAILQTASGGTQINSSSGQSLFINIGNSQAIKIDSDKIIRMENQPAFLAQPASAQNNVPINAVTDVVFGTERFDQNGDFASNTFTAPVTGRYQLNTTIYIQNMDAANSYFDIILSTSNRNYFHTIDPESYEAGGADAPYYTATIAVLADMDASDTAKVQIGIPNNGTAQCDIQTSSTFSGFLAC